TQTILSFSLSSSLSPFHHLPPPPPLSSTPHQHLPTFPLSPLSHLHHPPPPNHHPPSPSSHHHLPPPPSFTPLNHLPSP
ncbi:predicted protein, partial [Nematostella vectensis]